MRYSPQIPYGFAMCEQEAVRLKQSNLSIFPKKGTQNHAPLKASEK